MDHRRVLKRTKIRLGYGTYGTKASTNVSLHSEKQCFQDSIHSTEEHNKTLNMKHNLNIQKDVTFPQEETLLKPSKNP